MTWIPNGVSSLGKTIKSSSAEDGIDEEVVVVELVEAIVVGEDI